MSYKQFSYSSMTTMPIVTFDERMWTRCGWKGSWRKKVEAQVREALRWFISLLWWSFHVKSTPSWNRLLRGAYITTWSLIVACPTNRALELRDVHWIGLLLQVILRQFHPCSCMMKELHLLLIKVHSTNLPSILLWRRRASMVLTWAVYSSRVQENIGMSSRFLSLN